MAPKFTRPANVGGRPTKLTEELIEKVVSLIRAGNYIETACAACGMTKGTYYRWLQDGANAKTGLKKRFCDAIEKAVAEAEIRDLNAIDSCAVGRPAQWAQARDEHGKPMFKANGEPVMVQVREAQSIQWQAAAWRLERRNPRAWGRRDTMALEHSGPGGKPVQIEDKRAMLLKIAADPAAMALAKQLVHTVFDGAMGLPEKEGEAGGD